MKLKLKLMAAAIALAASAGADARIINSAAGNGELFFTLYDAGADLAIKDDDRAYVRDLGWLVDGGRMNDWVSATTTHPLPALNANKQGFGLGFRTIYSIAADANLQSFLADSTDTARLRWNIAAGDAHGTDRVLTTATTVTAPVLTRFRGFSGGGIDTYLPNVNNFGIPDAGSIILTGRGAALGFWSDNFGGRAAFSNAAGLGGSLGFFALSEPVASGRPVDLADVRQFMADSTIPATWTLEHSGELIYAAVPEPGAYAMFLAGLGLVGFMARRRLGNRV